MLKPLYAIPFLIASLLIGFAGWRPAPAPAQADVRIDPARPFRAAGIIFSPAALTLRRGQSAQVALSLDTNGLPVTAANLSFSVSDSSSLSAGLSPGSGCSNPGGALALRCQIQENAAKEQLVPLGALTVRAGQTGETASVALDRSSLIDADRLRYFPTLTIQILP